MNNSWKETTNPVCALSQFPTVVELFFTQVCTKVVIQGNYGESSLLSLGGSHAQTLFLLNGVQLVRTNGLRYQIELLAHGLVAIRHADVRNVSAPDVVALLAFFDVVGSEPVALHLNRNFNKFKPYITVIPNHFAVATPR